MSETTHNPIIIDTREQLPLWKHPSEVPTTHIITQKLDVGDYTTPSLLGKAHAERKNPNDLYNSIIQGHTRFRAELTRASTSRVKMDVFVECTEQEFYAKTWDVTQKLKCPGPTLKKILRTMSKKYKFSIIWCSGRPQMRESILAWLKKHEET